MKTQAMQQLQAVIAQGNVRTWAIGKGSSLALVPAPNVSSGQQLGSLDPADRILDVLARSTRDQAVERGLCRLLTTALRVTGLLAIAVILSLTDEMVLIAVAAWNGLCVIVASWLVDQAQ